MQTLKVLPLSFCESLKTEFNSEQTSKLKNETNNFKPFLRNKGVKYGRTVLPSNTLCTHP